MKTVFALLVAVSLTGCLGTDTSVDQDMAIACSSYNKLGETAVTFHDQMDESQRRLVDSAVAFVGPTCTQWANGVVLGSRELVEALTRSIADMLAATQEFET